MTTATAHMQADVTALVDDFYARVLADPLLRPLFRDPNEDHAGRMVLWLVELLGGPREHTAQRGGLRRVMASHSGGRFREDQRRRWIEHMRAATAAVDLDPRIAEPLWGYLEPVSHTVVDQSFRPAPPVLWGTPPGG